MVKECEKVFRGYHPELHAHPLAGRSGQRGSSADVHAGLPLVLEQHYSDVKGVEHQRLTEQRRLAAELHSFECDLDRAAHERSELRRQLPQVSSHMGRIEVALRALESLAIATSTLQLEGSTPATHSAVLAAHLALTGSNATIDAACTTPGASTVAERSTAGQSLRLWRPLFVSPALLLATVWLVTAAGGVESELAGLALVPAAIGSLLGHAFGTLEYGHTRWLWIHFGMLVCPWLGSWTIHRFLLGDWILALVISLALAPLFAFGFKQLLKLRERLRVQQRLELGRLAPPLFIASLSVAAAELYLTIAGLACALSEPSSLESKANECAGRVFGQTILAFHVLLVYVLFVSTLNQPHRGSFLRLELTSRQLLDGDLNSEEVKMLVLFLLSTVVALLLQQMATVAPASLWPSNIDTQPPLLGAALITAYAVVASALAVVVVLEATRPTTITPMPYDANDFTSHAEDSSQQTQCNISKRDQPPLPVRTPRAQVKDPEHAEDTEPPRNQSARDVDQQGEAPALSLQTESFRILPKRSSEADEHQVISSNVRIGGGSERMDRGPSHPDQTKKGGFVSKAAARRHVGVV